MNSEKDRRVDYEIRHMKAIFEKGELGRRDFMQGLMATGLAVPVATAMLAGSRDVRAMTPKKGGRIRFAWDQHGPADTNDPILYGATIDYARGRTWFNSLLRFNDDLTMSPELAKEWDINSDATEFTFNLQKGVQWHDGKPFTADDVVYSMNRHLGQDTKSKANKLVSMIKEWKKIDSHTVKAMLDSPNSDLPAILGTFHFKIIQDGAEGEYFLKPIGTGPFKCKEFTPGVRSLSVRNDNYWVDGAPHVDEIECLGITDSVARVNALVAGDINILGNLDPKAIKQVEEAEGVSVFSVESGAFIDIVVARDRPPGESKDFVLALKYLQRREKIVNSILKGRGVVGNDHQISPAYPEHCADLPQRPYDPEKAKFHLKKSGVTTAEVEVAEVGPGLVDLCVLLQHEAQKIGLDFNVKRVPGDGYWGAVWMNTPICVSSWNMRPTANIMLSLLAAPDAAWNESMYRESERMGFLLEASRAELDPVKRQEMFCEMQEIVKEDYGVVIPAHRNYIDAIADNIKGLPRVPLSAVGGCEWPEFVWIDS